MRESLFSIRSVFCSREARFQKRYFRCIIFCMKSPEFMAQEMEKKELKGLSLAGLPEHLSPIPEGVSLFESVPNVKERLVDIPDHARRSSTEELVRDLPLSSFANFSKEEVARMWLGSVIMWDRQFEEEVIKDPFFAVMDKIHLALWHNNGDIRKDWNAVVEIYEHIRHFSVPDAETTLDYTKGSNSRGYAENTNIFLDSEMAFLIHQKGEHVFTLGFSVGREPSVYLAQAQSPIKKGNRFLFSLGEDPVNGAVDLMLKNFKGCEVYVIDPDSLVEHLKRVSVYEPEHPIPEERIRKTYGALAVRYDAKEREFGGNKYHKIKI